MPRPTSSSTVKPTRIGACSILEGSEVGDGAHDLCDACLVVRAEQRRAVGRDDVVAERAARIGFPRRAAPCRCRREARCRRRPTRHDLRLDVRARLVWLVSTCAINPTVGPRRAGQRGEDVPVLGQLGVLEAELAQLALEQLAEVPLLRSARIGLEVLIRVVSMRTYRRNRSRTSSWSSAGADVRQARPAPCRARSLRRRHGRCLHAQALVRRVDVRLRQRDAAEDRRDAVLAERGDDRQRPARAREQRPPPITCSNASSAICTAGSSGETSPGSRRRRQLDVDLRTRGRRLAHEPLDLVARSFATSWPGASRTEKFACAATGTVVFGAGLAAEDAVHVDRGLGRSSAGRTRPPRRRRTARRRASRGPRRPA